MTHLENIIRGFFMSHADYPFQAALWSGSIIGILIEKLLRKL